MHNDPPGSRNFPTLSRSRSSTACDGPAVAVSSAGSPVEPSPPTRAPLPDTALHAPADLLASGIPPTRHERLRATSAEPRTGPSRPPREQPRSQHGKRARFVPRVPRLFEFRRARHETVGRTPPTNDDPPLATPACRDCECRLRRRRRRSCETLEWTFEVMRRTRTDLPTARPQRCAVCVGIPRTGVLAPMPADAERALEPTAPTDRSTGRARPRRARAHSSPLDLVSLRGML